MQANTQALSSGEAPSAIDTGLARDCSWREPFLQKDAFKVILMNAC